MRIGVIGATGYGATELFRLLSGHSHVEVTRAYSRGAAGQALGQVVGSLRTVSDLVCRAYDPRDALHSADLFFLAMGKGEAMRVAAPLLAGGKRCIDLSGDFRLPRAAAYPRWYGFRHASPGLLRKAVYGLPSLYRERIRDAVLVANPGCYVASAAVVLAPLLKGRLIRPQGLIVDSKSGASGAGRSSLSLELHYPEMAEGVRAYRVTAHQHTPEMETYLGVAAGEQMKVTFTAHLLPMSRGILSTCYCHAQPGATLAKMRSHLRRAYHKEPFVRLLPAGTPPDTKWVMGSNYCDVSVFQDKRTDCTIVMSALDNMVGGMAGLAVQNMNLMCGWPETTGLAAAPLFP